MSKENNDGIYEINDELIDLYMDYRVEYQMKPILMEYVNDGLIERSEERLIKELAWENFKK